MTKVSVCTRYRKAPGEDTTREEDLDDGAVEELLFGWS